MEVNIMANSDTNNDTILSSDIYQISDFDRCDI